MGGCVFPPKDFTPVCTTELGYMDAFGKDWFDVREGEASIFKSDGNGGYKLIARVHANEWSKLAGGN